MKGFVNFVFYNVAVYCIYAIIDFVFTVLGLYSNDNIGTDLSIAFTSLDITLIIINAFVSMALGLVLMRKFKQSQL